MIAVPPGSGRALSLFEILTGFKGSNPMTSRLSRALRPSANYVIFRSKSAERRR